MKKMSQTNYVSPAVEIIEMEIEDAILSDSPTGGKVDASDLKPGTGRYDSPAADQAIW